MGCCCQVHPAAASSPQTTLGSVLRPRALECQAHLFALDRSPRLETCRARRPSASGKPTRSSSGEWPKVWCAGCKTHVRVGKAICASCHKGLASCKCVPGAPARAVQGAS
eukprot:14842720-Alexandrium_andersonii.AAC.1